MPHLSLAQVYTALSYHRLHVEEIEADILTVSEENLKNQADQVSD
jgi:hypothetical protein